MLYLLGLIYARLDGQTNAFLYSRKGAEALEDNEHKWLVKLRILFFVMALTGIVLGIGLGWKAIFVFLIEGLASIFAFSFFHNGHYNRMMDRIFNWNNGWKHSSPTDTSDYNFTYVQRRNQFIISIGILVVGYTLFYFLS